MNGAPTMLMRWTANEPGRAELWSGEFVDLAPGGFIEAVRFVNRAFFLAIINPGDARYLVAVKQFEIERVVTDLKGLPFVHPEPEAVQ